MNKINNFLSYFKFHQRLKLIYIYILVVILVTLFSWVNGYHRYNFGFEFGNIATSLASGQGFSNVHNTPSGPTSWCSPSIVAYYALLFKLFGIKSPLAFWALMLSRIVLLSLSFYFLCHLDFGQDKKKLQIWYLIFFVFFSNILIRKDVGDRAFIVLLVALTLYFFHSLNQENFKRHSPLLYFLAIILPLTHISLAAGFMVFAGYHLFLAFYDKTNSLIPLKHLVFSILIFFLTIISWGVRNKVELGVFIPFKSNLWLEVYISNVVDEDGLLRSSNFALYHPNNNDKIKKELTSMGEIEFLRQYEEAGKAYLVKRPGEFIYKVSRRLINSFIFNVHINDKRKVKLSAFSENDVKILSENNLIRGSLWISLALNEEDFHRQVNQMDLSDQEAIIQEWKAAKRELITDTYLDPKKLIKGMTLSLLPSIGLIICLCFSDVRRNKLFLMTLVLHLLCIGPYILISHYGRYQTFLILFFTIYLAIASSKLSSIIFRKKDEITFEKETQDN